MNNFLSLDYTFFTVLGYPMSFIEFFGTIAGLVCVWLASKNNILTWPIGLINVSLFFAIFYQVNLYSDMALQVYFFVTGIIGWYYWYHQKGKLKKITLLSTKYRILVVLLIIAGTIGIGLLAKNVHIYFPKHFSEPAAYPFWDALTTTLSVLGNLLLALRILESWALWILVNIISTVLYFQKGVLFISLEYLIFLFIASYGLHLWIKEYQTTSVKTSP